MTRASHGVLPSFSTMNCTAPLSASRDAWPSGVVTKPPALASILAFDILMSAPFAVAVPRVTVEASTSLVLASYTRVSMPT